MKRFLLTLQFLTKIPIKYDLGFDEEFHKGIVYFPLVGFIIGLILYLTGLLSLQIFPYIVTSIIIVFLEVLITGGLHIDGLGDTFDALYSYRDKEKMLEIMKDSRLGTNSLLAILFLIIFKIAFVYSFISMKILWIVLFMPMISRLSVISMLYKTKSPREKGMGNVFIGKASNSMVAISLLYTTVIILLFSSILFKVNLITILMIFVSLIFVLAFVEIFKRHVYKKIGGVTGDILGCTIELSELVFIIIFYICNYFIFLW